MDTTHAIDALRSLSADAIRQRLAELEGERDALRVLLRSAVRADRTRRAIIAATGCQRHGATR